MFCIATLCSCAGVGLGCIASCVSQVTEDMMLAAARAVAEKLTRAELAVGSVLPDTKRIRWGDDACTEPTPSL